MADSIADEIIKRQEQLATIRAPWETHWREIAERILPRQNEFFGNQVQGSKRTEKIFDSTAPLALDRFAAALEGMLVPATQKWHRLRAEDAALNDNPDVLQWFDDATNILFRTRYRPEANFAAQAHETFTSLGAFGTGCMLIDEIPGRGVYYKSVHVGEIFIAENNRGIVDTVYRKFPFTAHQAATQWGPDLLPEKIKTALEKDPDQKFDFIHCVKPNEAFDPRRADHRGKRFSSEYVSIEGRQLISIGGYHSFPLPVTRYTTSPRETYGRSPAMTALADIKMINEMNKTIIRAAHQQVAPPLLLHDDGVIGKINLQPNGLNVGGVDRNGRQMIQPLATGARVDIGISLLEAKQKSINDAFLVTLFQILVDTPEMTATEVLERAREKGILLAPAMGRQQTELLGPMIEREIDILARAGLLPPMPKALIDAGGAYAVEYDSPLSRSQRAEEAAGFFRVIEGLSGYAQYDPSVLGEFNPEEVVKMLVQVNGVPQKLLYTAEQRAAINQQKAQQQQMQQLLQAAPVVGKTAKDLASAGQTAGAAIV